MSHRDQLTIPIIGEGSGLGVLDKYIVLIARRHTWLTQKMVLLRLGEWGCGGWRAHKTTFQHRIWLIKRLGELSNVQVIMIATAEILVDWLRWYEQQNTLFAGEPAVPYPQSSWFDSETCHTLTCLAPKRGSRFPRSAE